LFPSSKVFRGQVVGNIVEKKKTFGGNDPTPNCMRQNISGGDIDRKTNEEENIVKNRDRKTNEKGNIVRNRDVNRRIKAKQTIGLKRQSKTKNRKQNRKKGLERGRRTERNVER
jgi:hypothetical protein